MTTFSAFIPGFRARAARLLTSPQALAAVVQGASRALNGGSISGVFAGLRSDLSAAVALVKAWASGDYRNIATTSVITLIAAILYFLAPVDAVPDLLPLGGYVDDAAVLAMVAAQLDGELQAFRDWQLASADSGSPPAALLQGRQR